MSERWRLVPLAEVLIQDLNYVDHVEPRLYPKLSVRLYGKGVVLDPPADGATVRMQKHQLAKAGQVILSEIWGKKGAIGIVPPEGEGALCTSHFFLFDIRRDRVEPGYLQVVFSSNFLELQLGFDARGTTGYAAVRPQHLLAAEIPLPPLPEQRRIVAQVDQVAEKLREAMRLRRETRDQVMSFVVSLNLKLAQDRMARLGELMILDERPEVVEAGKEYPRAGVKGFGGGLFLRAPLDVSQTTYRAFNRLFSGAIVLSQVKGWEGAITVCPPNLDGVYVSPEYRTFSCVPGMADPEYLSSLITTPWFWRRLTMATRGVGARRERTRPEAFLELVIPMPTVDRQEWAIPILKCLGFANLILLETVIGLDSLLPSILNRVFLSIPRPLESS